jgi:cyclopropane fatty-acyl-phospholipid synthase-like methyltransferase
VLADPSALVARGYDAAAERYERLEDGANWPRLRRLRALLELVPDGARVLDVGCGNGVPSLREIARRHVAVGIDVSRRQTELARANVPEAEVHCGDVRSAAFAPRSFGAIVSFYALDHVPRDEHADLLARFRSWLAPDGLLLLAVEATDEPGAVGEWLGVQMFFSCFDAETAVAVARSAGFDVVAAEVEEQLEAGRPVPYLWLTARPAPPRS